MYVQLWILARYHRGPRESLNLSTVACRTITTIALRLMPNCLIDTSFSVLLCSFWPKGCLTLKALNGKYVQLFFQVIFHMYASLSIQGYEMKATLVSQESLPGIAGIQLIAFKNTVKMPGIIRFTGQSGERLCNGSYFWEAREQVPRSSVLSRTVYVNQFVKYIKYQLLCYWIMLTAI